MLREARLLTRRFTFLRAAGKQLGFGRDREPGGRRRIRGRRWNYLTSLAGVPYSETKPKVYSARTRRRVGDARWRSKNRVPSPPLGSWAVDALIVVSVFANVGRAGLAALHVTVLVASGRQPPTLLVAIRRAKERRPDHSCICGPSDVNYSGLFVVRARSRPIESGGFF